jgi:hypothetical protein
MRMCGAILVVFLAAMPATAQIDTHPALGVSAKPSLQAARFRKPAVATATLQARAAARGSHVGSASPQPSAVEDHGIREAAARVRKRPSASPAASRDAATSVADRLALQLDLAWAGEYNGLINGEANEKTTAAIKSFQRDRKFKETGVLNTQERALLAASAKAKQAQVGWSMLDDPATGARLGIPAKQVPNRKEGKPGTRWSSAQGQVQVETFSIREPGTTLASVYERQKKEPANRKLDLSVMQGDFFILSGMQTLKRFYVRADFKDGEVRGMTVLYDQATENIMDPVAVVMASAFTGFPDVSGFAQIGSAPKRKVEYGTGIVVSDAGHVLTEGELADGCSVIVVGGLGDADRVAQDRAAGLALLRLYGVPDLSPASFASEGAKAPDVTLLGIADPKSQGGGGAVSSVAAKLRGEALEPAPQPGFSGAAVLAAESQLVGMVQLKIPLVAAVGSANAQAQASMIAAPAIRAFLEAGKIPPVTVRSGPENAKAAIVRVICVRK